MKRNGTTSGKVSRRQFVQIVASTMGTVTLGGGLLPRAAASSAAAPVRQLAFFDSASGANFVNWFQTYAFPKYRQMTGVEVKFTSIGPAEAFQRLKAWTPGQGDVDIFFIAGDRIGAFARENLLEDLRKLSHLIPNLANAEPPESETIFAFPIEGRAVPFYKNHYVLAYNSDVVKNPPTSFKDLFNRGAEWKGKLGYIDARSPISGTGRLFVGCFLRAFGCDLRLQNGRENATWGPAWEKLVEFEKFVFKKHANSGGEQFGQITQGDVWIAPQAKDFIEYTKRVGSLPPSTKTTFLEEGTPVLGSYASIPRGLSEARREAAARLVNFLLSEEVQVELVNQMQIYPTTNVWEKVNPNVYKEAVPTKEQMRRYRAKDLPMEALEHIVAVWATKVGYGG